MERVAEIEAMEKNEEVQDEDWKNTSTRGANQCTITSFTAENPSGLLPFSEF